MTEENTKKYNKIKRDYTSSKEWMILREKALERDRFCQCCGSTYRLAVHHRTYKRITKGIALGEFNDVIVLCGRCHGLVHSNQAAMEVWDREKEEFLRTLEP